MMKLTSDQWPRHVYTKIVRVNRFGRFLQILIAPIIHATNSTPNTEYPDVESIDEIADGLIE